MQWGRGQNHWSAHHVVKHIPPFRYLGTTSYESRDASSSKYYQIENLIKEYFYSYVFGHKLQNNDKSWKKVGY